VKEPKKLIRFDSKAQMERARRAAKIRKWDLNRFIVEATEQFTDQTLATVKAEAEQQTVTRESLSLNQ